MKAKAISDDDTLTFIIHSPANERNKMLMKDAGEMEIASVMLKDGELVLKFEAKKMGRRPSPENIPWDVTGKAAG